MYHAQTLADMTADVSLATTSNRAQVCAHTKVAERACALGVGLIGVAWYTVALE